ncbi:S9 family peptidase [Sphingomonas sp. G-3-2-10]|uniref:alpha/beta hydrolase family protein n=1 Tax=Sphingomonas sp. G-3-2-10 TaxID=2728838 RepID=UPI00146D7186|nr:S9 family peptidase [Sphingomonas sp. G-3-2-10]NML07733.1 S9 family peptidase [Sphingomonas sp. G-3-2-10]
MNRGLFGAALAVCALVFTGMSTGAALASDPPRNDVPTAADLGAAPILSDPLLSPDGARIAARGLVQGVPMLVLADVTTPEHRAAPVGLPRGQVLDFFQWAGSDRLILGLIDGRKRRMVIHDVATGAQTPLEQGGEILHVDRAGRFLLLSGGSERAPAVYRIDLATGAATLVVKPQANVQSWHADSAGVIRAGISWDGGRRSLLYRAGDGQKFVRAPRTAGEGPEIDQIVPVQGSDRGYAIADNGRGRFGLYRYDFTGDRLGELVFENPRVDLDGFEAAPDGRLLGVIYTADHEETTWIDPVRKSLQKRVDAALPGRANRILSTSDPRALIWSSAGGDAGAWYVFDRASGRADLFVRPRATLTGKRLSAVTPVRYAARDGLEVPGYLTLPAGRDPKDLPLIVMPHGGPFARDVMHYDSWVQYLASKGYAVLQPNFRGSTGFGRAYEAKGDGEWGRAMQDDIDDGVKWLAARGTIDPKRVCIMGASFGGYAAMWGAIRNPELYRCAISYAGVSDIAGQLAFDRPTFENGRAFRDWQARIQGDARFPLDSISPLRQAARVRIPLLIAHGTADDIVPVSQSLRMHEALDKLDVPHEFVTYPGETHQLETPANEIDFMNRVGAFLDRHNPS